MLNLSFRRIQEKISFLIGLIRGHSGSLGVTWGHLGSLWIRMRFEIIHSDVLWGIIRWNACRCYNHYIRYSWYCWSVPILSRKHGIYLLPGSTSGLSQGIWSRGSGVIYRSQELLTFNHKSVFEIESIRLCSNPFIIIHIQKSNAIYRRWLWWKIKKNEVKKGKVSQFVISVATYACIFHYQNNLNELRIYFIL